MPFLTEAIPFHEAIEQSATHRIILDEQRQGPPLVSLALQSGDTVGLLLGPEGGWADRERQAALDEGWRAMSLGPNVLRAETAGISALAAIAQRFAVVVRD